MLKMRLRSKVDENTFLKFQAFIRRFSRNLKVNGQIKFYFTVTNFIIA